MGYNGVVLRKSISINKIYSIHYFEYMSDFSFEGETHDFWEFLCVDKGEVNVTAGSETTTLKRGDIAFHQPNEFHSVQATGKIAPNLVVISFHCEDEAMAFFCGKTLRRSATSWPASSSKRGAASTAGWTIPTSRICPGRDRICSAQSS